MSEPIWSSFDDILAVSRRGSRSAFGIQCNIESGHFSGNRRHEKNRRVANPGTVGNKSGTSVPRGAGPGITAARAAFLAAVRLRRCTRYGGRWSSLIAQDRSSMPRAMRW